MKSFLSDRPRVGGPANPPPTPAALAGPTPALHAATDHSRSHGHVSKGPATVECVREGDRVARLIVTCPCGERIEIDCVYGGA